MSNRKLISIKTKNILVILPVLFFTLLFTNSFTNETYAAASLTVSGDAIINLSSLSAEGTFAKSGNIDITASTDSPSGYKLMIQANNSTSLVSGSNEITSLEPGTSISEETFKNGNYNGKWGFKPSMFNSTANSNFLPSPSTTGDVINATACANGTGICPNEDSYTIAIGAKVNNTQPIGTYANTFNIMLVSNGIEYSVTYRTAQVSNMPEDTAGETSASTVTLSSNTPTREGYSFLGWCTVQPAVDGSCSGTSYAAGGTYMLTGSTNDLTLYARWGKPEATIATAIYMQDVTSCPDTIPLGTQYTLIDKRDGKIYTAARQADGKCWMTQNLDLDIGSPNTASLTSENTNLNTSGSGAYSLGYKIINGKIVWTPAETATVAGKSISGTTITGWKDVSYLPYSVDGNDVYAYTSGSDSDDTVYNSLSACKAVHTEAECKHYHVGNYYNWSAAVASNYSVGIESGYVTMSNDICPRGWRLPVGLSSATSSASTREFGQLFLSSGVTSTIDASSYASGGFNKLRTAPLFFVRGGYTIDDDRFVNLASNGTYWSSSANNFTTYSAYFYDREINSASYISGRGTGHSIRCVVR